MERSCFLIGNRDVDETILPALESCIIDHIEKKSVHEFIVGQYENFDHIAAKTIIHLKEKYPFIILTLLTPYHPGDRRTILPKGFDGTWYPFEKIVPPKYAIVRANKAAIDHCLYLIACINHPGKARDFLMYAMSRENRGLSRTVNIGLLNH